MTTVGLVTNWNEHCAVAEYARNLVKAVSSFDNEIKFKVIEHIHPLTVWEQTEDCDVIHYNYCAHSFKNWMGTSWFEMRDIPKILTFHESSDWQTRRLADSGIADLYIIHDKLRDGMPTPSNVETIPFGVPEVDGLSSYVTPNTVGTFGCAFPWKALLPLAYACEQAGKQLYAYISEPSAEDCKIDFDALKKQIWEIHPKALIQASWGDQDTVIRELSHCEVLALPFDPAAPINGISASVRFALAAQRPLVLTWFHHYADLYQFEEEIHFVFENSELQTAIENASRGCQSRVNKFYTGFGAVPKEAREKYSWKNSARAYESLYKSIRYVEDKSGKSLTAR